MANAEEKFNAWCASIAQDGDFDEFLTHFKEHVCEHSKRENNRQDPISMKNWVTGVLNFAHIFEKRFPEITTEDKLFKLCKYNKKHTEDPDPNFDVDAYMREYSGDMA